MMNTLSIQRLLSLFTCTGFLWLLSGCHSPKHIPLKTQNNVLNGLLDSTPVETINIDHFPVDTVFAKNKNVMGRKSVVRGYPQKPSPNFIKGIIKIGDSLYVGDQQNSCIWVINDHGTWIHKIGRRGHGPGEFERIIGIMHNSKNIFVVDRSDARIDVYNNHFKPQTFFYQIAFGEAMTGKDMAASNGYLYVYNGPGPHKKLI